MKTSTKLVIGVALAGAAFVAWKKYGTAAAPSATTGVATTSPLTTAQVLKAKIQVKGI